MASRGGSNGTEHTATRPTVQWSIGRWRESDSKLPGRSHERRSVGILTTDDRARGLWRDAETLRWALAQRGLAGPRHGVTLFAVSQRDSLEEDPLAACASSPPSRRGPHAAAGARYADWLQGIHTLISVEYMMPRAFAFAASRGVDVVFVPNLDWAILHPGSEDTAAWISAVRDSGARVWARTPSIGRRLRELGVESEHIPWSIPDRVAPARRVRSGRAPFRFLVNAGTGGFQNRRGVDIALRAFRIARRSDPALDLTIKTIPPLDRYLPADLLPSGDGVTVRQGFYRRSRLAALHAAHDAVLHPSRWEGFGIALLEALHAGVPVLATDGWPMNEVAVGGESGLLIHAAQEGWFRLAPRWECDVEAMASAMVGVARDDALRARLESADRTGLELQQRRFVETVRESVGARP
jgi:glycosyltransferase involved in cell wall biosynthesis